MKKKLLAGLVTGLFLFVFAGMVNAAPVTCNFSGEMVDPFGSITVGTPFSVSFSYDDSQLLNISSGAAYRGDYNYLSLSVTINGETVTDNGSGGIYVYDHDAAGGYPSNGGPSGMDGTTGYPTDLLHLYTGPLSGSFGGLTLDSAAGIQIVLQDITGNIFDEPKLPTGSLSAYDFTLGNATFLELRELWTGDPGYASAMARGEIPNAPVPEPATFILLGSGLAGLAFYRRKRK